MFLLIFCASLVLLVFRDADSRSKIFAPSHLPSHRFVTCWLFYPMGNNLYQWRVTVGMFYCRCQRIRLFRKVSIRFLLQFCFIRLICRFLKVIMGVPIREKRKFLNENFYVTMVQILLTIAGGVEQNLGPEFFTYSLSRLPITHMRNR